MITYKIDVMAALKSAGYSAYRLRNEKLLTEFAMQKMRDGEPITWPVMAKVCELLNCQPGDLIMNVPG